MFLIDELARICGENITSIQILIDDGYLDSNLKCFNMKHVERIRLIRRLKSFEICKSDIEMVLADKIDVDNILKVKNYEIENRIERERKMIEEINVIRESFSKGKSFISEVVKSKPIVEEHSEIWACSVRQRIHINAINSLLKKLQKKMDAYNLKSNGCLIRIFHEQIPNKESADIELAFPIEITKTTPLDILKKLPSGKFGCLNVVGEYDEISLGYSTLYKWIKDQKYKMSDLPLEFFESVYLSKDGLVPEIQLDIAKEPIKFKVKLCIPVAINN